MRHVQLGPVRIDLGARRVQRPDGAEVRLTPIEHRLVQRLIDAEGAAVSQQDLLRDVWGYRTTQTRTLATTIRRLRQKIEVDEHAPAAVVTVPGVGYRLAIELSSATPPAALPSLPGREAELAAVRAAWMAGGVATLVGPPGCGSSTVASTACVSFEVTRVPGCSWGALSHQMGWALAEPQAEAVIPLLGDRPLRIWWDGDVDEAVVRALAAERPRVTQLVTATAPLGLPNERVIPCVGLPPHAAILMLGDGPPDLLAAIASAVDHLPLALTFVQPWIAWIGAEEVLRALQEGKPLQRGGSFDLQTLAERAMEPLDGAARQTLRALAAFADGAHPQHLLQMAPDILDGLRPLLERQLVARSDDGRLHPLRSLRQHLHGQGNHDMGLRHAEVFARLGDDDSLQAVEARGERAAVLRLVDARADLQLAHGRVSLDYPEMGGRLALAAAASCAWRGDRDPVIGMLERSWRACRHRELGPRLLAALCAHERAAGRVQRAWALLGEAPDADIPELLLAQGTALRGLGRLHEALVVLRRACDALPPGSDAAGCAQASVMQVELVLGNHDLAEQHLRAALAIHDAAGHRRRMAHLMPRYAAIEHAHSREWRPAIASARASMEAMDATDGMADVAATEGMLLGKTGEHAPAYDCFLEAAERYRQVGAHESATRMTINAAGMAINLGLLDAAWTEVHSVLPLVRRRSDRQAEATCLFLLGELQLRRGETAAALPYLEPALALAVSEGLREQIEERLAHCR